MLEHPVVVHQRVRRPRVAVEGHAHAARVDELNAERPLARERQVGVAERPGAGPGASPSSSSSSGSGSGRKLRTSETGEPWQYSVSPIEWASGSAASSATSASPSSSAQRSMASRAASGASSGAAVQRSPLPRIQVASSSRSRSTVSRGQAPNSA